MSKKSSRPNGFTNSIGGLIVKIVILLLIPIICPFICGIIDNFTKLYWLRVVYLIVTLLLWVAAIFLIVVSIVRFVNKRKSKSRR